MHNRPQSKADPILIPPLAGAPLDIPPEDFLVGQLQVERGSLEVKERLGHRWWGWTLVFETVVASLLAVLIASEVFIRSGKLGLLASYLILILIFPVVNFFRALIFYNHDAYEWVKEGRYRPVRQKEWRLMPRKVVVAALLRGLIRLEFFGWIVWVSTSMAATAGALQRSASALIDLLSQGRSLLLVVPAIWSRVLNDAAFDLIRATVIGAIVLFFAQLIRKFQITIDKADVAAKDAHRAAMEATRAVAGAYDLTPLLDENIKRTLSVLKTSYRVVESETLSYHLARTLEIIANSYPALKQVEELSGRIVDRIRQINEEITHTYLKDDPEGKSNPFDLLVLSAIYTTYLKVETLSFEGEKTGQRGCRLSTRYPHYALAVRSVVKALESLGTHRYRYYTIFNRAPEHFFNPENPNIERPLANINWSFLFLEDFCRWNYRERVPYTRYFVTLDDDSGRLGKIPPTNSDIKQKLPGSYILCFRNEGEWRPCLWGDSAWLFFSGEHGVEINIPTGLMIYSRDDIEVMRDAARVAIPPSTLQETLRPLGDILGLSDPSYVIVKEDRKGEVEAHIRQLPNIQLRPLKEMLERYHNPESPPQILKFESWNSYKEFFGETVPRDLFAVWDCEEKSWCLCIGAMVGESDPTAVEMICTTKDRVLSNLPWSLLNDKLSVLFCEDPTDIQDCVGLSRESF